MNERLRLLREEIGFSRAAFGQRIGVSGDVINNLERGRVEIKEHIIKLICSEFLVNESWLRTGSEPMFLQTSSGIMEQLKKEFNLDEFSFNLVHEYLKLEPAQREKVRDFFYRVIEPESMDPYAPAHTVTRTPHPMDASTDSQKIDKDNSADTESAVEEAESAYIKSRSKNAQKTVASVTNTTKDTRKAKTS